MNSVIKCSAPSGHAGLRGGRWSLIIARRPAFAASGLMLACALIATWSLAAGPGGIHTGDVLAVLAGRGTATARLLVLDIRLPRVAAALLAGGALGLSGCLIQCLTHNRLATPDILGLNEGATLAVLIAVAGSPAAMLGPWWVAPAGAAAVTVLLLLLAGDLGTRGYRLLLVGLAVAMALRAGNELLLSRQSLEHASAIYAWRIGGLGGRDFSAVTPAAIGMAAIIPAAIALGRALAVLRLTEDTAAGLGLRVRATQLGVLLVAVVLAGLGVGVGGPIGFVALAAPILAAGLAGRAHVPLLGSLFTGALLVVAADTAGRLLIAPTEIPAGVVTSVLGGPFLLWLVVRGNP